MTMAIGVDPRIRARRIAVRRAEGRRRLRFLLFVTGLVAVAVAGWAISRSPLLDLDHVRVEGVVGPRARAVEQVLGVDSGTPLVDLDLGTIEAEIRALPWVADVRAGRDWPGTLSLTVVEREAVATLRAPDGLLVIGADGVVIEPAGTRADLPAIALDTTVATGEVETAALPALAVVTALPADLEPWIDRITVAPDADAGAARVGLDLVGAARVEMGSTQHLADKLASVRAVLGGADLSCVRLIDVTMADRPVVRRDGVCDGSAAAELSASPNG